MTPDFLLDYVDFSVDELAIIGAKFHEKTIPKGHTFLGEGAICEQVAFVREGSLYLSQIQEDGTERLLDFFTPGDFVSDYYSYLTRSETDTRITAYRASTLWTLHRRDALTFYDTLPTYQALGRILAEKAFIQLATSIKSMGHKPIERYQLLATQRPQVIQTFPQYMIASYLGMSPEWLSKIRGRA